MCTAGEYKSNKIMETDTQLTMQNYLEFVEDKKKNYLEFVKRSCCLVMYCHHRVKLK